MKHPDCNKCKHYFVTLDEYKPKGCRVFNIKGPNMPSVDVRRFTGHHCPVFEERVKQDRRVIKEDRIFDSFA